MRKIFLLSILLTLLFNKLKTSYSGLTPNELKLCAYIRINLTSKEIAQMLHNTADTVNKSRYDCERN